MPKLNLTRRWVRARPGSVLILVIALLVLLALIGTAYLSSTQTERYSAVQNDINTQADLLIQGVQVAVNGALTNGLFGNGPNGTQYRPPTQEMPTYDAAGTAVAPPIPNYHNYDSVTVDPNLAINLNEVVPDLILGTRIPSVSTASSCVSWDAISWPLFADSSQSYNFDSPFEASTSLYKPINKGRIQSIPTYKFADGKMYPGMLYFVPPNSTLQFDNTAPQSVGMGGAYLAPSLGAVLIAAGTVPPPLTIIQNPTNPAYSRFISFAASAAGDGIADAGLTKLPIGQVNGITYYYATRVVDGNSAINASSAWTQGNSDAPAAGGVPGEPATNFGFFRAGIGLKELLDANPPISIASPGPTEVDNLNTYRFPLPAPAATGNVQWYSQWDQMEHLLINRPGIPLYGNWLGQQATAALAYRSTLKNLSSPQTPLELHLVNELYSPGIATSPWSPAQVGDPNLPTAGTWYYNNFLNLCNFNGSNSTASLTPSSPLRTLLVGNNAVANTVPAWYGNTSGTTPAAWTASTPAGPTVYKFGDWVVDRQRSFVCIQQHLPTAANEPQLNPYASDPTSGFNPAAVQYWAGAQAGPGPTLPPDSVPPGMPWSKVPVKTSINTAKFEQLWLGFAQVMTDSIGMDPPSTGQAAPPGALTQWQPPMQTAGTAGGELQMPQFRSVMRDSIKAGLANRSQLTASQMLKLRAAIAAVNTIDLRGGNLTNYTTTPITNTHNVTSKHIFLADAAGYQQYDVELFGGRPQPYISEMVAQVETTTASNFVAIELVNPYPFPINMSHWALCIMDRSTFTTGMQLMPLVLDPANPIIVPAATTTVQGTTTVTTPGVAIVSSAPSESGVPFGGGATVYVVPTLNTALGKELVIVRPRFFGTDAAGINSLNHSPAVAPDAYVENDLTPGGCADMVPVDQLDLTGLDQIRANLPARLHYRRASQVNATPAASWAWNFVYPGPYHPEAAVPTPRMDGILVENSLSPGGLSPGNLGVVDAGIPVGTTGSPSTLNSTYSTAPIQIANELMAGPRPLDPAQRAVFPFGQFTRNADMLQVPFIGSYRIRVLATPGSTAIATPPDMVGEFNSVTIDSTLANDTTIPIAAVEAPTQVGGATAYTDPHCEQIGRFCPVGDPTATTAAQQLDFGPGFDPGFGNARTPTNWHYHWAEKLFDYFTVQSPQDDYYPNADPARFQTVYTTPPTAVANYNSTITNAVTAGQSEDTVGSEGLININTAPAAVLAQLPFTAVDATYVTAADKVKQNAVIAQMLVADRTKNGPFKSIYDLYRVNEFRAVNKDMISTTEPDNTIGDFSPGGTVGTPNPQMKVDNVRYDFKERFLLLNNISNLITTRSDTFTCYVLLQGWRNVGTGHPTLAVERRAAFLVDRNAVTPGNNQPISFKIPH